MSMCERVCVCVSHVSHVQLFATPWRVARQAPLSMGFSRQGYWRGLLFPPPGDLPDPGIKPRCAHIADGFFTIELRGKPMLDYVRNVRLENSSFSSSKDYVLISMCTLSFHFCISKGSIREHPDKSKKTDKGVENVVS